MKVCAKFQRSNSEASDLVTQPEMIEYPMQENQVPWDSYGIRPLDPTKKSNKTTVHILHVGYVRQITDELLDTADSPRFLHDNSTRGSLQ